MDSIVTQASTWLSGLTLADYAEVFFVVLTIVGQRFNASRDVRGYYFWLASNVGGVIFALSMGRPLSALLYCYLGYECARGIRTWKRLEREAQQVKAGPAVPAVVAD